MAVLLREGAHALVDLAKERLVSCEPAIRGVHATCDPNAGVRTGTRIASLTRLRWGRSANPHRNRGCPPSPARIHADRAPRFARRPVSPRGPFQPGIRGAGPGGQGCES